ncbi:DUF924 family protein [Roseovarius sp. C03]|uniref:DUF924 family protein n=1 Tax=Roseovarius sp. C03 TaxID=3449222 RepID=UPI003EDB752C
MLTFWSRSRNHWFSHDPIFDRRLTRQFGSLHQQAASGALGGWEETPNGCLALLILLDQYPRNAFRGKAQMYAHDAEARRIARRMVDHEFVEKVPEELQLFCLLPFAHSENIADQEQSVELHRRFLPGGLDRARRHRKIIARFGRFPHRNAILGRAARPTETDFLRNGGFQG